MVLRACLLVLEEDVLILLFPGGDVPSVVKIFLMLIRKLNVNIDNHKQLGLTELSGKERKQMKSCKGHFVKNKH